MNIHSALLVLIVAGLVGGAVYAYGPEKALDDAKQALGLDEPRAEYVVGAQPSPTAPTQAAAPRQPAVVATPTPAAVADGCPEGRVAMTGWWGYPTCEDPNNPNPCQPSQLLPDGTVTNGGAWRDAPECEAQCEALGGHLGWNGGSEGRGKFGCLATPVSSPQPNPVCAPDAGPEC